jgi:uncharacterized protein HemX
MFDLPPEILNGVIAVVSGLGSAIGAWSLSKRQQRAADKATAQTEMESLIAANSTFRMELKKDLDLAKLDIKLAEQRIESLESQLNAKDRTISELTAKVIILAAEVRRLGGTEYDFSSLTIKKND